MLVRAVLASMSSTVARRRDRILAWSAAVSAPATLRSSGNTPSASTPYSTSATTSGSTTARRSAKTRRHSSWRPPAGPVRRTARATASVRHDRRHEIRADHRPVRAAVVVQLLTARHDVVERARWPRALSMKSRRSLRRLGDDDHRDLETRPSRPAATPRSAGRRAATSSRRGRKTPSTRTCAGR